MPFRLIASVELTDGRGFRCRCARVRCRVCPTQTATIAGAAFRSGSLAIRDELGEVFFVGAFLDAFGIRGRPGISPGQLAMVTVLQFAENLTDRQAADAVRGRIDWKYLLGLELTDPGFDFSVLSQFRTRLVAHHLQPMALDMLLERLVETGLVKARGRQRTDATHVLAAVRDLNRLEMVGETLRAALEALAAAAPGWLRRHRAGWPDRSTPTWRNGTRPGSMSGDYPASRPNAATSRSRWATTGGSCYEPSPANGLRTGCGRSRRSRSCAGYGSNSMSVMNSSPLNRLIIDSNLLVRHESLVLNRGAPVEDHLLSLASRPVHGDPWLSAQHNEWSRSGGQAEAWGGEPAQHPAAGWLRSPFGVPGHSYLVSTPCPAAELRSRSFLGPHLDRPLVKAHPAPHSALLLDPGP